MVHEVIHGCYWGDTGLIQDNFPIYSKDVTWRVTVLLEGCYKGVTMYFSSTFLVLIWYFPNIFSVISGTFNVPSRYFPGTFKLFFSLLAL